MLGKRDREASRRGEKNRAQAEIPVDASSEGGRLKASMEVGGADGP